MKVFNNSDIREIDAYTISNEPVSSIDLMERAAKGCAEWIVQNISVDLPVKVFTGPGNNGGDGWAIARILAGKEYKIQLFHLNSSKNLSPDSQINRERLIRETGIDIKLIEKEEDMPLIQKSDVIIDALFGSGLSRPLEGLARGLVQHINRSGCSVISVDIPSGLFGEDNSGNNNDAIIRASVTLTLQFPKRSFFFAENEQFTGVWHLIPIGLHQKIINEKSTDFFYTDEATINPFLKKRTRFSHKGLYGHGLLIAGSYGMMGASVLAARACLRTGVGLLTTHVPGSGYAVLQAAVPESIFSIDPDENFFTECPVTDKFSALAAGPGIGTDKLTVLALELLIRNADKPLLLDADALNIISEHQNLLELLPENTILTPHPGEFDRLAGKSRNGSERNQKQISMSKELRIIIALKGANTSVTLPDGRCYYNSTGNPGMATAGSGDVLTGMILSLLTQGYQPDEAALAGVYMHGLAGDIALSKSSQEALIASDIIENIGNAFNKIRKNEKSDV